MEEIEVKRNPLGIKVFVVGKPDIEHMTEDEYGLFVSSLEMRMNEYLEKKMKASETCGRNIARGKAAAVIPYKKRR